MGIGARGRWGKPQDGLGWEGPGSSSSSSSCHGTLSIRAGCSRLCPAWHGHFKGHIFTQTEGIQSSNTECSGGSWRRGRSRGQIPPLGCVYGVEGLPSSPNDEYTSQLYRWLFIVQASDTRAQGDNMHLHTSTMEGGTVSALRLFLCCFPLLHHPVLLLHQARPCIAMVAQVTV